MWIMFENFNFNTSKLTDDSFYVTLALSRELIYYLINMENLTKHQLILVALLISFVTSIATGIVTVSLMDQAPKGVTQTINRVVERTVERVVTEPPKKGGAVVKETIVVKEEDKIIEAIEKNAKAWSGFTKWSLFRPKRNR